MRLKRRLAGLRGLRGRGAVVIRRAIESGEAESTCERISIVTDINCEEEIDNEDSDLVRCVHFDEGRFQQGRDFPGGLCLVQERAAFLV